MIAPVFKRITTLVERGLQHGAEAFERTTTTHERGNNKKKGTPKKYSENTMWNPKNKNVYFTWQY